MTVSVSTAISQVKIIRTNYNQVGVHTDKDLTAASWPMVILRNHQF